MPERQRNDKSSVPTTRSYLTPIEDIEIANNIYMFRRYEKQMIAFQTDRRLSEHAPAGHNHPEDHTG